MARRKSGTRTFGVDGSLDDVQSGAPGAQEVDVHPMASTTAPASNPLPGDDDSDDEEDMHDYEGPSPLDLELPPPSPAQMPPPVGRTGVPKRPKSMTVPLEGGVSMTLKLPNQNANGQQAQQQPEQPQDAGEPSVLDMLAGAKGATVEVERIGPGKGRGWKGEKFRGRKVEYGRVGRFKNDARLLDNIDSRAGGATYLIVGLGRDGKAIEITKTLPGAPKALTAIGDDEELDDEEDMENMMNMGGGVGVDSYGAPPAHLIPPGYVWDPRQQRVVQAPHAPVWDHSGEDWKEKFREAERKRELEDQQRKYEDKLKEVAGPKQDPQAQGLTFQQMIQTQMDAQFKLAAEERKARAEEMKLQLEREKNEKELEIKRIEQAMTVAKQEREDREKRERDADERREKREAEERKDRERRVSEERDRQDKRDKEEREARERIFQMQIDMMKSQKPASVKSALIEAAEAFSLVERMRGGGEPSRIQEVKEIIETVGVSLREAFVPAAVEAINSIRGRPSGQAPNPNPQNPQVGQDAPAGQIPMDAGQQATAAQVAVTKPAQQDLSRENWLDLVDTIVRSYQNKNTPGATKTLLIGYCHKRHPWKLVQKEVKSVKVEDLAKNIGMLAAVEENEQLRANMLQVETALKSEEGAKWFGEFQGLL